jgi:hypothetical protein
MSTFRNYRVWKHFLATVQQLRGANITDGGVRVLLVIIFLGQKALSLLSFCASIANNKFLIEWNIRSFVLFAVIEK